MKKPLILSLLSAALLSCGWLLGTGFSLLFAFVPLLLLQRQRPKRFALWSLLTFFVWIMACTWWVGKSTWVAWVAIPAVGLIFSWLPFMIYHYVWLRAPRALAYTVLVTLWVVMEKAYMVIDVSFPWLTLGNGFAADPMFVQWYSLTGVLGGTLWIWVSNLLYLGFADRMIHGQVVRTKDWLPSTTWIVVPAIVSVVMYYCFEPSSEKPVEVCVVQPNIDPYSDKFKGMSQEEQFGVIRDIMVTAPALTQYFVMPETAINDNLWIDQNTTKSYWVQGLRDVLMAKYPAATAVIGATTIEMRSKNDPPRHSVRHSKAGYDYEVFNSCLWVDTTAKVDLYHKSKLVVGVEAVPYPAMFGALSIDLGGIAGNMGVQSSRSVYNHATSTGTAICYESIYGEYFAEYILRGAQIMFIITNDGWWGNTQGHIDHLNYARLRAIETRRPIARSANTGISALINARGDVVQELGWWQRGQITGAVIPESHITPYVRYGDFIARLSGYVLALSLLYFISFKYRNRR